MELFQTYMDALCKCDPIPLETIWTLSIAFVGIWAILQNRIVPVDSLLFLKFISFPKGAIHWSRDRNLELC